jgi:hypothetical protein
VTEPDTTWQPFLITPPVPDYPSTHTVLGWAAAEALIEIFGDTVRFSASSLTLPGVTRHFKRFSEAAEENGLSRLYAGIHFRQAVRDGRRQGRSIGRAVAEALPPVRRSSPHWTEAETRSDSLRARRSAIIAPFEMPSQTLFSSLLHNTRPVGWKRSRPVVRRLKCRLAAGGQATVAFRDSLSVFRRTTRRNACVPKSVPITACPKRAPCRRYEAVWLPALSVEEGLPGCRRPNRQFHASACVSYT